MLHCRPIKFHITRFPAATGKLDHSADRPLTTMPHYVGLFVENTKARKDAKRKEEMTMNKTFMRTVLSLALCLVVCASLFCTPAFAAGNTVVIIGGTVDKTDAAEPSTSIVVSGGNRVGTNSSSNPDIAADGNAPAQVIVGSTVEDSSLTQPTSAVVVQPDGTIKQVGHQQAAQNNATEAVPATLPVAPATAAAEPTGLAAELLAKVNQVRAENGVGAVKYSAALQSIADTRVKESIVSFGHTRPDGSHCSTAVTVDWNVTGENLIQVTSTHATADLMMETWLNSPTHKYNILLDQFTDMAVGTTVENGTTYVSLIFVG